LFDLRGRYHELYTRQHGLETNLFLAPGEGDSVPVEESAMKKLKADQDLADALNLVKGTVR